MLIKELELISGDLPPLRAFWAGTIGLPVHVEAESLVIRAGTSQLRIRAHDGAPRGGYHIAFNIPSNRFAEAKAWLSRRVTLLKDASGRDEFDFPNWNAHSIYFTDADGNILELIARHGLANATDRRFDEQDILAVSEVGLAVDDVATTVVDVAGSLHEPVYDGAGSDAFSAVGDEHGLLIVVARGRIWYPNTGVPAVASKLSAVVETGAGERVVSGPPYEVKDER